MKYKCEYETGGEKHSDGIWERKDTAKTIRMTKIEEWPEVGVYAMHKVGESFKVGKGTGNPLEEYEDGTFTIYFRQAGTPYYFEKV
jgi:hypothetical protein